MNDESKIFIFIVAVLIVVFTALVMADQKNKDFELKKLQIFCDAKKG